MSETFPETPRWRRRFDNYARAVSLLRQAMETMDERELSQLEQEGVIQRFEYTWELAWNLLKDRLRHGGVTLATVTPSAVIKAAHTAKFIERADVWMRALDARNKMSHTYDCIMFEKTVKDIKSEYFGVLYALYENTMERALKEDSDA